MRERLVKLIENNNRNVRILKSKDILFTNKMSEPVEQTQTQNPTPSAPKAEASQVPLEEVRHPKTQNEALQILVGACELAQSRGAFKLGEAAQITAAVVLFQKSTEDKQETQ